MARSKKLPSKVATGNIEIQNESESIQALFGFRSPYSQKTREEYESYLNELPVADLQRHAVEHGVIPSIVSRSVLITRLINQFVKNKISYIDQRNVNPVTSTLSKKDEQDVANLLARAR